MKVRNINQNRKNPSVEIEFSAHPKQDISPTGMCGWPGSVCFFAQSDCGSFRVGFHMPVADAERLRGELDKAINAGKAKSGKRTSGNVAMDERIGRLMRLISADVPDGEVWFRISERALTIRWRGIAGSKPVTWLHEISLLEVLRTFDVHALAAGTMERLRYVLSRWEHSQ